MSEIIKTMGTTLTKTKSGAETTDWKIGSLTSISEVGAEASEIDVTTLDSPDQAKEYLSGEKDAGDIEIEGFLKNNSDESTIPRLMSLMQNGTVESWTVTYPSGAKWEFRAFVKSVRSSDTTTDGQRGFSASFRVSGLPKFTVGSTSSEDIINKKGANQG